MNSTDYMLNESTIDSHLRRLKLQRCVRHDFLAKYELPELMSDEYFFVLLKPHIEEYFSDHCNMARIRTLSKRGRAQVDEDLLNKLSAYSEYQKLYILDEKGEPTWKSNERLRSYVTFHQKFEPEPYLIKANKEVEALLRNSILNRDFATFEEIAKALKAADKSEKTMISSLTSGGTSVPEKIINHYHELVFKWYGSTLVPLLIPKKLLMEKVFPELDMSLSENKPERDEFMKAAKKLGLALLP